MYLDIFYYVGSLIFLLIYTKRYLDIYVLEKS
jgi:hypothetical protein